jgi:hypothetical protein
MGKTQVGAAFSYATPDFWIQPKIGDPKYQSQSIAGVTGYGDYDFTRHLGVEGDFHCLCLITSLDRAELTYFLGPRLMLPYGRFVLYGKALAGIRDLYIQEQQDNVGLQSGSNIGYSIGGGLDIFYNRPSITRARAGPDTAPPASPPLSSPSALPIASATDRAPAAVRVPFPVPCLSFRSPFVCHSAAPLACHSAAQRRNLLLLLLLSVLRREQGASAP